MGKLRSAFRSSAGLISADEAVSARIVALTRCLLALAALIVCLIDPTLTVQAPRIVLALLGVYAVYSVALAAAAFGGRSFVAARAQPWLDGALYSALAWFSGSAGAVFFASLLFAIAAASFSRGFVEGLALTLVAGVVVAAAGLPVQAAMLALLGALTAWWGGYQLAATRRLQLLKDLLALPNPRLGVDHALNRYLVRLRAYFAADACVLVCAPRGTSTYRMYRVDANAESPDPQPLTESSAKVLLALPPEAALVWDARSEGPYAAECRSLANLLEAGCLATVPYSQPGAPNGRLYLAARRSFGRTALELLREAALQVGASVDHVAVLEGLMANAAQAERSRISHDIHDTTMQPYVGLKLGLEALQRRLGERSPLAGQVADLVDQCTLAIDDVRGYVARLRGQAPGSAGGELVSALRRQAGRYRRLYGVDVEVRSDSAVKLVDRVAAEAFQIACEGLSNVYRHTQSRRAFIDVRCGERVLALEIGNEHDAARPAGRFMPRSITERAAALGGAAEVRLDRVGHDVVRVTIPL
jgi:signal transduction histidine kinase